MLTDKEMNKKKSGKKERKERGTKQTRTEGKPVDNSIRSAELIMPDMQKARYNHGDDHHTFQRPVFWQLTQSAPPVMLVIRYATHAGRIPSHPWALGSWAYQECLVSACFHPP